MKILQIGGYFLLPDEFEGTNEEALDLYVQYRKSKGYTGNQTGIIHPDESINSMWDLFLYAIDNTEYKWTGDMCVLTSASDGTWIRHKQEEVDQ